MIGKKVEAEFQDGDTLVLTVSEHFKDVPFVDGMSGKILTYNDISLCRKRTLYLVVFKIV
jgi:hypothetical protein